MQRFSKKIRIVVTGPESTGKTTLAKQLAEVYKGVYLAEFAREYVEGLNRKYDISDIDNIARHQINDFKHTEGRPEDFFVFDTFLIITKVWYRWVYGKFPEWVDENIRTCKADLYLLCKPDIPWEFDPVRENGGENRDKLYNEYKKELEDYNFKYAEITGNNENRINLAILAVNEIIALDQSFSDK